MSAPWITPDNPCTICGGTTGRGSDAGEHLLCIERQKRGNPTPCLGLQCPECHGHGHIDKATGRARAAGVMFFADGSGAFERHMKARFPKCQTCDGKGSVKREVTP